MAIDGPSRRAAMATAAITGWRPPRRAMKPDTEGVFPFVIVGGGGAASGVFVYDPVVAKGDLIASITDALTSPTGDTTLQGITSYGGGGFSQMNGGAVSVGRSAGEAAPGVLNESAAGVTRLISGQAVAGDNSVAIFLNGGAKPVARIAGLFGGTTAQVLVGSGLSLTDSLVESQGTVAADSLDYIPAATAPPAQPAGTEVWNAISFNAAHGWTNSGAGPTMKYRLIACPPRSVEVIGDITSGTTTDNTSINNSLAAAYQPATTQTLCPVTIPGTSTIGNARLLITTTWFIEIEGLSSLGAGTRITFHGIYSLDA
jgi:hypothetical protein